MYFSAILKHNDKRTQFHADDKTLARDGFMMNVMCVLQKLSVKIKLERVDPMYPFHWESMINISKDTKLRYDETEYKEWIDTLRKLVKFIFTKRILNFHEFSSMSFRKWTLRRQMGTSEFPDTLLVSHVARSSFSYIAGHSTLQQTSACDQRNQTYAARIEQHQITLGKFRQRWEK